MVAQALKLKKAIESEVVTFEEKGITVKVSGDQKIKELVVNGVTDKNLVEVINKALKNPKKRQPGK